MTFVSDAVPLTPGVAAVIRPPTAPGELGAVVVQNLSPYYCRVNLAGAYYSLPAYTADLYELGGAGTPITLTPTNPDNSSGLTANAVAVWYGPDELPDAAGYPASIPPNPAAVAAATAAALLAQGVPVAIRTKALAQSLTVNPYTGNRFDVTGYGTAVVRIIGPTGARQGVYVGQTLAGIDSAALNQQILTTDETGNIGGPYLIRLVGDTLIVTVATGAPIVDIELTSATYPNACDFLHDAGAGDEWTIDMSGVSGGTNAGTRYAGVQTDNGAHVQGLAMLHVQATLPGTTQGHLELSYAGPSPGGALTRVILADTSEMTATQGSFPVLNLTKLVALPAVPYALDWRTGVAQNPGPVVTAHLIPANL